MTLYKEQHSLHRHTYKPLLHVLGIDLEGIEPIRDEQAPLYLSTFIPQARLLFLLKLLWKCEDSRKNVPELCIVHKVYV